MARTSRPTNQTPPGSSVSAQRRAKATEQAQTRLARQRRRWIGWGAAALAVAGVAVAALVVITGGDDSPGTAAWKTAPLVGGDLHTVTTIGDALYVGGHTAAAVSRDGGRLWQQIPSLADADPMGWAVTPDSVLVGGHPGLFRSTDDGATFSPVSGSAAVPDVHALGGVGAIVYLASPQVGLLASTDAGRSWQVRNAQAGRSFMGTILVDPKDPDRLIAPDMAGGLVTSTDGGRTWKPLGGPMGAMAVAWNPADIRQVVAVGMNGGARSTDGGATWQDIDLPEGSSAVSYDPSGQTLYAGALEADRALIYSSADNGVTWTPTA